MSRAEQARPYREIVVGAARALADWPDPEATTRPIDELAVVYSPVLRKSARTAGEPPSQPRTARAVQSPTDVTDGP